MSDKQEFEGKYFLLAQNSNGTVLLGIKGQDNCILKSAREVLSDPYILPNLMPKDAAIIGVIAGMEINEKIN